VIGNRLKVDMMRGKLGLLVLLIICAPALVFAEAANRQHLFKIERSKNANIVQYDVQLGPDGKLLEREPVVAYWIRLAEQGQVEELSWVQRTFAFGFKARPDPEKDSVELEMKAGLGRPITVVRDGSEYRATILIDGSYSYLDRIFIQSERKGISVKVEYVELFGEDVKCPDERYEKFIP
jgi:hypothetical protein